MLGTALRTASHACMRCAQIRRCKSVGSTGRSGFIMDMQTAFLLVFSLQICKPHCLHNGLDMALGTYRFVSTNLAAIADNTSSGQHPQQTHPSAENHFAAACTRRGPMDKGFPRDPWGPCLLLLGPSASCAVLACTLTGPMPAALLSPSRPLCLDRSCGSLVRLELQQQLAPHRLVARSLSQPNSSSSRIQPVPQQIGHGLGRIPVCFNRPGCEHCFAC
jgi:hypothetical protein